MNLITIDSKFPFDKVLEFCENAEDDESRLPAIKNMVAEDWQSNTASLLYAIYIEKRFDADNGGAYIGLEVDGKIVGGGGYCPLQEDKNVCQAAVRTYTLPAFRSRMIHGFHIIPEQLRAAKEVGYKAALFTFNDYNLWLRYAVKKYSVKAPAAFAGWTKLDYTVNIRYTEQHVLYRLFDDEYTEQLHRTLASIRANKD